MVQSNKRFLQMGCAMLAGMGMLATCLLIGVVVYILANNVLTVGSEFTTAVSLAYDVIYETKAADVNSIQPVQSQTIGNLTVVVVQYEVEGTTAVTHVLTRQEGRQYLVESADRLGGTAVPGLVVEVWHHPNRLDSELLVYGRVEDDAIERIQLHWSMGYQPDVPVVDGTFLFFQSWSPVDGLPQLDELVAYDAAGSRVLHIPVMP